MFKREAIPLAFAFELSNRCNMSAQHDLCPTKANDPPVFLNTDLIKEVIVYFGSVNWKGGFYFNLYNEPMIDPRLFMFLELVKENNGNGCTIFTNGWGVDKHMIDEVGKLNAGFSVSCYSEEIVERFKSYGNINSYGRTSLNPDVKKIYDSPPTCTGSCHFPSTYGTINHKGYYQLCCREYKYQHPLGDCNTTHIKDILASELRNRICDELEAGVRSLDVCKRCFFPGWGIV